MDYDLVTALTFVVFAVIMILAILPRAGYEEGSFGSTPESIRAAQRERARRRHHSH